MKQWMTGLVAVAVTFAATADTLYFDISPPGTSAATGLSPSNEVHMVVDSTGSGNEILTGIRLDTETLILDIAVGYGSAAGFDDLTGPAVGAHLHGPAGVMEDAGVLVDLSPIHMPAGDPAKGGLLFGSVMLDSETASNLVAGLTYLNVHTDLNGMGEIRGQLVVDMNQAPILSQIDPLTVECTSEAGATATLSVEVSDADDDEVTVSWTVDGVGYQTNVVAEGTSAAGVTIQFMGSFGLGTHEIIVTAVDPDGESAITMTTVTVVDTTPPEIHSITATPDVLWPPNHRLVPVRINVDATDACGPVRARITGIMSNEPINGLGDGNTQPDYKHRDVSVRSVRRRQGPVTTYRLVAPLRVLLRAERSGQGSGRVYTVEVEVRDTADNISTASVDVVVPHDRGQGNAYGRSGHPSTTVQAKAAGNSNANSSKIKIKGKKK